MGIAQEIDDMTTAYLVGFHKRDDEVAELKARVAKLKKESAQNLAMATVLHMRVRELQALCIKAGIDIAMVKDLPATEKKED